MTAHAATLPHPVAPRTWRDAWLAGRNRLFADPRFQRWAADFPLTRPVAHARTQGLFDLVAGFVYSQTLSACVRLRLFQHLSEGPMSTGALATALDLPFVATVRLLGAARGLGLVQAAGPDRHALGAQGAALLGNPGLMEMIEHHARLYADLGDSVGLLRRGSGELADYWPYATSTAPGTADGRDVAAYSALMAATQPTVAADLLAAYPVRRHRRLMDVGGGEGGFLEAAGAWAPKLELMLYDLPAVAERARTRLGRAGLLGRTTILQGDFLSEPIPPGADLITLVRILHDHDEAGVATLLRAIRAALPADGALLIGEPMSGGARAERVGDVYFAFYLLAMGRGRARSPEELTTLLHAAGFSPRAPATHPHACLASSARRAAVGPGDRMDTLAVVIEAPERLSLRRLELNDPGPGDVVVEVAWSGISTGTERLLWSGRMPPFPGLGYPLVPGYESVGRIVEAGAEVRDRVGDYVFAPGSAGFKGARGLFGGAARRLVLPAARTIAIAESLGERGALIALAATARHAIAGGATPELIVGHGVLGRLLARLAVADGGAPQVWETNPVRRNGAGGVQRRPSGR